MRCFPVVLALLGFAMAAPRSAMAGERTIPELEAELEARLAERFQRAVVLAQICEASGDRQGAATHYEFARRIDGTDIYVLSQLAVLYRVQRDDARLLSIYETLSRTQPASIAWLRELGSCHFRLGHGEEAEAAWRRILDVYPNRAGALRYLAPIYVQHGLYDKAWQHKAWQVQHRPHKQPQQQAFLETSTHNAWQQDRVLLNWVVANWVKHLVLLVKQSQRQWHHKNSTTSIVL